MIDKELNCASDVLVEKEVELADGKRHKLFFKEIPGIKLSTILRKINSADDDEKANGTVSLILSSVCNEDGTPGLTEDFVLRLKTKPLNNIFSAALDVTLGSSEGKD